MDKEKIFTKSFILEFIALFCSSLVLYILMTTVTERALELGASSAVAGLASSGALIGELVTRFFFSGFLKKTGWKKMLFISQIIQLIGCCMYFFTNTVALLLIVRFVHGIFYGFSASVVTTTGMFLLPKSRYGEANGYLLTSVAFALAAGPTIGGAIKDTFGQSGNYIAAIIVSIVMFIAIYLAKAPYPDVCPETPGENIKYKGIDKFIEKKTIPIALCVLLTACAYVGILSFIRLYAASEGMTAFIPAFFAVYAVVLIISRPIVGKIQDRYGDAFVIYPCIIFETLSMLLLALFHTPVTMVMAGALCSLGYGNISSCINAIACRGISPARKSYAVSTFWVGVNVGMGIGPVILGAVSGAGSYSSMYLVAAAFAIAAAPAYMFLCRPHWRGSAFEEKR